MKYKVIDPKGFHFAGSTLKKGDTFESESKNAHIQTGLHFRQIESAIDLEADAKSKEGGLKK